MSNDNISCISRCNKIIRMKFYIIQKQGSMTTTTVTIKTSADGTTTITTSSDSPAAAASGAAGSGLSSEEISLIRDSWAVAKDIPAIQTRTLIE